MRKQFTGRKDCPKDYNFPEKFTHIIKGSIYVNQKAETRVAKTFCTNNCEFGTRDTCYYPKPKREIFKR